MKQIGFLVAVLLAIGPLAERNTMAAKQQGGHERFTARPNGIPGRYIVRFTDAAAGRRGWRSFSRPLTEAFARAHGISRVTHVYTHALNGFRADMNEDVARRISKDPRVFSVAQVSRMELTTTQYDAPWGLDRLDGTTQTERDGTYSYENDGSGVTAYVLDSGIRASHNDFGGRATLGPAFVTSESNPTSVGCIGHGTAVAGILGGITHGVAKDVDIVAIRVKACSEEPIDSGDVVAAVNWVTANHVSPAVANMSFTVPDGVDEDVDYAVQNLISAGVTVVIAAGNSNADAVNYSPQRVSDAILVAATGYSSFLDTDYRWSSSNHGDLVDLYAPGIGIPSPYTDHDNHVVPSTGTSFAAPHVTGIAARYLELFPNASPSAVRNAIVGAALEGEIHNNVSGTPNLLANSVFLDDEPTPPQYECEENECLFADEGLYPGWNLESENGQYVLSYQGDGNLVVYSTGSTWTPVWASNTDNTDAGIALMQSDGNFVVYDDQWVPHWSSCSVGNSGAYLKLHNSGVLNVYSSSGAILFSSLWSPLC